MRAIAAPRRPRSVPSRHTSARAPGECRPAGSALTAAASASRSPATTVMTSDDEGLVRPHPVSRVRPPALTVATVPCGSVARMLRPSRQRKDPCNARTRRQRVPPSLPSPPRRTGCEQPSPRVDAWQFPPHRRRGHRDLCSVRRGRGRRHRRSLGIAERRRQRDPAARRPPGDPHGRGRGGRHRCIIVPEWERGVGEPASRLRGAARQTPRGSWRTSPSGQRPPTFPRSPSPTTPSCATPGSSSRPGRTTAKGSRSAPPTSARPRTCCAPTSFRQSMRSLARAGTASTTR